MIKEEWNAIIEAKLKDGISIDDLKHKYADGIEIEPNIVASDLEAYDHTVTIDKPWINMVSISGGSSEEKNTTTLQALNSGANGLSIELSSDDDVKVILNGVHTAFLDVRIDCQNLSEKEQAYQKSQIDKEEFPNVRWVCNNEFSEIHISEKERVNSIKNGLKNVAANSAYDIIVTLSKNLLFEIASLRAIRALVDEKEIEYYNIISKYEVEGSNELGDYNLIEKTYKIMSAILGGTNAILTDFNGDEASRLTLNIQNVLDLESGMKLVMDPIKGAYYIEKLTGEIIRQVKTDA